MDTLRVSATDIDAFRRYQAEDDVELADLLSQLRREEPPTESMLAGTALHSALEHAEPGEHGRFMADGYAFTFEAEGEIDLPSIREMKATRDYAIGDCLLTLVGKVDAIHGRRVDDHKYTSQYDAERYLGSYQWRIYLEVFGADEFRWNIFEGREDGPKSYVIRAIHKLTMHRYPGMADDIERELYRFVAFARFHLPERFNAPARPSTQAQAA